MARATHAAITRFCQDSLQKDHPLRRVLLKYGSAESARTATLNHRGHSMRVLLTGCNTPFGSALAEYLSSLEGCELRLTDRTEQPGDPRTRL